MNVYILPVLIPHTCILAYLHDGTQKIPHTITQAYSPEFHNSIPFYLPIPSCNHFKKENRKVSVIAVHINPVPAPQT